jgi:hypothetical protein
MVAIIVHGYRRTLSIGGPNKISPPLPTNLSTLMGVWDRSAMNDLRA